MTEVFLIPGRAVDEQTLELPPEVYSCLDRLVQEYQRAATTGRLPIVIASGRQRSKFVYNNNPLRYPDGHEVIEAELLAKVLEDQGVPCLRESRSASVGDNFAYSKQLLLDLPELIYPTRLHIFTISSLAHRLEVLSKLIFGPDWDIQMHTVSMDTQDPETTRKLERKLFGDQLCMLLGATMSSQMLLGDHTHIIGNNREASRWPILGREHDVTCQYAQDDSHPDSIISTLLQHVGIL